MLVPSSEVARWEIRKGSLIPIFVSDVELLDESF
jgi:hypothetical protein